MKINTLLLLCMLPALVLFTGCPVGTDYSLGEPGTVKLDQRLIGTWATEDTEHELQKIRISKKDEYSYTVEVLEKGEMFMADDETFTAWIANVDGKTYLYAIGETEQKYYLYNYELSGEKGMYTRGTVLIGKGLDEIKTAEEYRSAVAESVKKEGGLTDASYWVKE